MGNLTFSEIIWIVVIILIVFGPNRLPELARKTGQFVAKARAAATALQRQITEEYGDAVAPLKEVGDELKEVRKSLSESASTAARDIEEASSIKDVSEELKQARRQIEKTGTDASRVVDPSDAAGSAASDAESGEPAAHEPEPPE